MQWLKKMVRLQIDRDILNDAVIDEDGAQKRSLRLNIAR
jgi:hypothetical protein